MQTTKLSRAQGCIMGQFAGDSLGALVEFCTAEEIHNNFPNGLRDLMDGGVHDIIAGQPTDDSEMALALARTITANRSYSPDATLIAYTQWVNSKPFDIGRTIVRALGIYHDRFIISGGHHDPKSQANGAMMRVSPLGIFGANYSDEQVDEWAKQDCLLTHLHPVCVQANQLYTTTISYAIRTGVDRQAIFDYISDKAQRIKADSSIQQTINLAQTEPPKDYLTNQGWVIIALHNALWQLLHAESTKEGIVNTVTQGGDTDTNACICGALLGAVYGIESIPRQWIDTVTNCRPDANNKAVVNPRPEYYWATDILYLAEKLLSIGEK